MPCLKYTSKERHYEFKITIVIQSHKSIILKFLISLSRRKCFCKISLPSEVPSLACNKDFFRSKFPSLYFSICQPVNSNKKRGKSDQANLKIPRLCRVNSDIEPNRVRWVLHVPLSGNIAKAEFPSGDREVTLNVNVGSKHSVDHQQGRGTEKCFFIHSELSIFRVRCSMCSSICFLYCSNSLLSFTY